MGLRKPDPSIQSSNYLISHGEILPEGIGMQTSFEGSEMVEDDITTSSLTLESTTQGSGRNRKRRRTLHGSETPRSMGVKVCDALIKEWVNIECSLSIINSAIAYGFEEDKIIAKNLLHELHSHYCERINYKNQHK